MTPPALEQNSRIARPIQVIAFVLAAFGGFLTNVAPPEEARPRFAVGGASLITLCFLLYLTAGGRRSKGQKRRWLRRGGMAVASGVLLTGLYQYAYQRLTFHYPLESSPGIYVAGIEMLPKARDYMQREGIHTPSAMVQRAGGLEERYAVWSRGSVAVAELILTFSYTALIVAFATAVFALTEGTLRTRQSQPRKGPKK